MGILTNRDEFTGTVHDMDVIHMVDVSDTTDNPAGTSFKVPNYKMKEYFGYWTSGSSGTMSVITKNSNNDSTGNYSVVAGRNNTIMGADNSFIVGGTGNTITSGVTNSIIINGTGNLVTADNAYAGGLNCSATTVGAHAEGRDNIASGLYSFAEGRNNEVTGDYSHAEGITNRAYGGASHAEGQQTTATGLAAHAQNAHTFAHGDAAHSQGYHTVASGYASHAGGNADGHFSGRVVASGITSFAHMRMTGSIDMGAFADESAILGGYFHNITSGSTNSAILGGTGNTITNNAINTVVLGGADITGNTSNMVYVPDLNIVNCPAYADDAAAGVGGLTTGMVYQTTGAGAAPLNAAGILMIKQ